MIVGNIRLNIFEQPWTLVVIGAWLILAVWIASRFWPLKFTRKHLFIGPIVIVLAFALDYLVVTDREKIETIMDTIVKATEEEQAENIVQFISPDYRDSSHKSGESFTHFCRQIFSNPQIEKNWVTDQQLELDKTQASIWITAVTRLDERNQWAAGISVIKTAWRLEFSKQPDKSWLIDTIELLELNDQPVDWTASK